MSTNLRWVPAQEIIGGWIRRKASVLAALLFSCANYFYKKAKQYFSPCPKLPRLETLWENLETRWIRNTAYLFCKSCFARRESKGGGVSPLLSALLIYPLSISWKTLAILGLFTHIPLGSVYTRSIIEVIRFHFDSNYSNNVNRPYMSLDSLRNGLDLFFLPTGNISRKL